MIINKDSLKFSKAICSIGTFFVWVVAAIKVASTLLSFQQMQGLAKKLTDDSNVALSFDLSNGLDIVEALQSMSSLQSGVENITVNIYLAVAQSIGLTLVAACVATAFFAIAVSQIDRRSLSVNELSRRKSSLLANKS